MLLIYFIYSQKIEKEGFSEKTDEIQRTLNEVIIDDKKKQEIKFQAPTSLNPFSNTLLLDKANKFTVPPNELEVLLLPSVRSYYHHPWSIK